MSYELACEGATSVPVIGTGTVVDACTAVSGTVAWRESTGALPELSLADGGLIAGAILALWATGYAIRAIRKQLEES